jgi:hypothetical protein
VENLELARLALIFTSDVVVMCCPFDLRVAMGEGGFGGLGL